MRICISILSACFLMSIISFGQLSSDRNYVSNNGIKKPGITSQAQVDALTSAKDRMQQVGYFDGLGRPIQSVVIQGSNATNDLVTPVEYDNYGREVKKYLPYADLNSNPVGSFR